MSCRWKHSIQCKFEPLAGNVRNHDFELALGRDIFSETHSNRARDGARDSGQKNGTHRRTATKHAKHNEEHGYEAVVDAQNDVAEVLPVDKVVKGTGRNARSNEAARRCSKETVLVNASMSRKKYLAILRAPICEHFGFRNGANSLGIAGIGQLRHGKIL